MLVVLDESTIREVALKFLRHHYKQRPAEGQAMLASGLRGEGGIVADGYLSFVDQAGRKQEIVLEATSFQTREELRYKKLNRKLNWDVFALSSWTFAILLGFSLRTGLLSWQAGGMTALAWAVAAGYPLLFGLIRMIAGRRRRYRYIYAIEQFKSYHSDDQWIAFGEDVFADHTDPFYRELRDQCIRNGIGLLEVDYRGKAHMRVDASAGTFVLGERRRVSLQKDSPGGKWPITLPTADRLLRFRKLAWKQIALGTAAWLVIGLLGLRLYNQRPVRILDTEDFRRIVGEQIRSPEPEASYFLIDSADLRRYVRENAPYLGLLDTFSGSGGEKPLDYALEKKQFRPARPGLLLRFGQDSLFYYPCDQLRNIRPSQYVVTTARLYTQAEATRRLDRRGEDLKAYYLGCLEGGPDRYLLFTEIGFNDRAAARSWLAEYRSLADSGRVSSFSVHRLEDFLRSGLDPD